MKITNNEIVVEWPEEKNICYCGIPCFCLTHNNAISEAKSLNKPRVVDVEALAKIITSEYYPCDERATLLARQIISNLSKFLVIKKGG